jgi:O-antigen/teichoic acid export membrane protein
MEINLSQFSNKNQFSLFIKNYFWQIANFISKILGLFWITPFLSSDKQVFGIYSLVVSFTVFLNYADLGFLKAAQQLGSQSYFKNDKEEELDLIGFSCFITSIIIILFICILIFFSFFPEVIIDFENSDINHKITASRLILILAFSLPFIFIQKIISLIFEIRLLGFKFYKIILICNIIPIFFVKFFYFNSKFLLVEYFFFIQLMNFVCVLIGLILAVRKLNYPFLKLIERVKFNLQVYNETKNLAFSSFYLFFLWFVWNELDRMFIGNLFGASSLPIFMVCNLFYTSIITVNGIVFQPLITKSNYIFSSDGLNELKIYLTSAIKIIFPLYLLVLLFILVLLKKFISLWIGVSYDEVVIPALFLISSFALFSLSQQVITYLTISGNLNVINIYSTIQAILYWILFLITSKYFNISVLIVSKALVIIIGHIYLLIINKKLALIDFNYYQLFKRVFLAMILVLTNFFLFNYFEYLFVNSSLVSFLIYYSICFCFVLFFYFLFFKETRDLILFHRYSGSNSL